MNNVYQGREQTEAKHIILRRYLQRLAFKTLLGGWSNLAYIDGFSGPWESRTEDHSDSSFMIAIQVLKEVQQKARELGKKPSIRCFFVEENRQSFAQLQAAVAPFHKPADGFTIETFNGKFEDAVVQMKKTMAGSFALTFIDPTGWTGYEFEKVKPVFEHTPGEVLLNFMFDFVNRFTASSDPVTLATFDGILGPGWKQRLDASSLPREEALTAMFNEQFCAAGRFKFVLSTPIEKLSDRTHFRLVYGTRSAEGLDVYRDVEFLALKDHGMRRAHARHSLTETRSGQISLFDAGHDANMAGQTIEAQLVATKSAAADWLRGQLPNCPKPFSEIWPAMLDQFMMRKVDAKQVCVDLGKAGEIRETWRMGGSKRRTPSETDLIHPA
ncbi:three-Cys-motif partner protein TcmP [Rhizobium sp. 16-449-1b]|uniref:three-Cys-motif partner protein TcmP n=1 Tax=Rhizobium sp. 16-449-1b TaxID=2819989 RepID=UPI001ADC0D2A|nr:three-Cys-motif partner protein TcmP [Rhizobium sp. 16-449-1b]MBO9195044.1 three-Cys-motif partner protein TcmP [Rhizobium sp. 16-449-1b]